MSTLAMILVVGITYLVGFVMGYLSGRARDDDEDPKGKGHPYDYK